jgi:DNA-binding CsgD family transcriptional regulator
MRSAMNDREITLLIAEDDAVPFPSLPRLVSEDPTLPVIDRNNNGGAAVKPHSRTLRVVISEDDPSPDAVPIPSRALRAVTQITEGLMLVLDGMNEAERRLAEYERPDALLTPREREVLQLLGEGLSNAGVAERLFVTVATVKGHVSQIRKKLRISRVGAARLARGAGSAKTPSSRPQ